MKKIGSLSKEIEDIKKNEVDILELKNTIIKTIKQTRKQTQTQWIDPTEERICNF